MRKQIQYFCLICMVIICTIGISSCKSFESSLEEGDYQRAYNIAKTSEQKNKVIDYMLEHEMYENAYNIVKDNDEKKKIISKFEDLDEQIKAYEIIEKDDSFSYEFDIGKMNDETLKKVFMASVEQNLNIDSFIKVYVALKPKFEDMKTFGKVPIHVTCMLGARNIHEEADQLYYAEITPNSSRDFDLFNSYKNLCLTGDKSTANWNWNLMRARAYFYDVEIEIDRAAIFGVYLMPLIGIGGY